MTVQHLVDSKDEARTRWNYVNRDLERSGIAIPEDPLILYIGSGWEYMLEFLTEKYRTIGLDDDDIIDKWKKCGYADVVRGDAHNLPFPDESVDIVFEAGLFDLNEYRYQNIETIVQEVYRVLTTRGIFCHHDYDFPEEIASELFQEYRDSLTWKPLVYTKLSD